MVLVMHMVKIMYMQCNLKCVLIMGCQYFPSPIKELALSAALQLLSLGQICFNTLSFQKKQNTKCITIFHLHKITKRRLLNRL